MPIRLANNALSRLSRHEKENNAVLLLDDESGDDDSSVASFGGDDDQEGKVDKNSENRGSLPTSPFKAKSWRPSSPTASPSKKVANKVKAMTPFRKKKNLDKHQKFDDDGAHEDDFLPPPPLSFQSSQDGSRNNESASKREWKQSGSHSTQETTDSPTLTVEEEEGDESIRNDDQALLQTPSRKRGIASFRVRQKSGSGAALGDIDTSSHLKRLTKLPARGSNHSDFSNKDDKSNIDTSSPLKRFIKSPIKKRKDGVSSQRCGELANKSALQASFAAKKSAASFDDLPISSVPFADKETTSQKSRSFGELPNKSALQASTSAKKAAADATAGKAAEASRSSSPTRTTKRWSQRSTTPYRSKTELSVKVEQTQQDDAEDSGAFAQLVLVPSAVGEIDTSSPLERMVMLRSAQESSSSHESASSSSFSSPSRRSKTPRRPRGEEKTDDRFNSFTSPTDNKSRSTTPFRSSPNRIAKGSHADDALAKCVSTHGTRFSAHEPTNRRSKTPRRVAKTSLDRASTHGAAAAASTYSASVDRSSQTARMIKKQDDQAPESPRKSISLQPSSRDSTRSKRVSRSRSSDEPKERPKSPLKSTSSHGRRRSKSVGRNRP